MSVKPPELSEELKAADEWAKQWMQSGSTPWEWYELMKLREAIRHLQNRGTFQITEKELRQHGINTLEIVQESKDS